MREWAYCTNCGSDNCIKKGKSYSVLKNYWNQLYQCRRCGTKFYNRVNKPDFKEPFKYENKPLPPINWSSYNKAQETETHMFFGLVNELFDQIDVQETQKTGRPSGNIKDILFCMLLKSYYGFSGRRLRSTIDNYTSMGCISSAPCKATLFQYFNDKRLSKLLIGLIELSALPIAKLDDIQETDFAVDSSGFSTSKFGRWFDYRFDKEIYRREYRKGHIMVGTKTNIVTAVIVTDQYGADSPQFKKLIKRTKLRFHIKEVSADKAYLSRGNLETVENINGQAYIVFKSNTKPKRNVGSVWNKMYWKFKNEPGEFYEKYHKRSNVETSFSMIKQKFGDSLSTKNMTANYNEILCKILCHNLCCLISAFYKFDLKNSFWTEVPKSQKITFKA